MFDQVEAWLSQLPPSPSLSPSATGTALPPSPFSGCAMSDRAQSKRAATDENASATPKRLRSLQTDMDMPPPGSPTTGSAVDTPDRSLIASKASGPRSASSIRNATHGLTLLDYYPAAEKSVEFGCPFPQDVQDLAVAVEDVAFCHGILPNTEDGKRARERIGGKEGSFTWESIISKTDGKLGRLLETEKLDELVEQAWEIHTEGLPEGAQNADLDGPLLKAALRNSPWSQLVTVRNMTVTIFQDAKRKIDYALTLDYSKQTWRRLEKLDVGRFVPTSDAYLRFRPLGVTIETKVDTTGTQKGLLQLISVSRIIALHYAELLRQTGRDPNPIVMPMLLVRGTMAYVYYIKLDGDETRWWFDRTIGGPVNRRSILQLYRLYQLIIQWMANVFRPWFEENILNPLLEGAEHRLSTAGSDG